MTSLIPNNDRPLVLVIDDDPVMQFLVSEALDAAGFDYREATSGQAGLELFGVARPDLVLLDVVMPGLDGFQTCLKLRALPGGVDVPVMMMTGSDDIESIHRAFEVGATDFVTKPINYPILGYRLRYMMRARENLEELHRSKARLTNAQRLAKLGYWEWNLVSGDIVLSRDSSDILGIEFGNFQGSLSSLLSSVHPDDRERVYDAFDRFVRTYEPLRVEHRVLRLDKSEAILYQEAEANIESTTGRLRLTGTFQDITERKQVEQKIAHLEFHDGLTNLPNRTYFLRCLREHIANHNTDNCCAAYEIRIDQLERLTNTLGLSYAQELAIAIAERLVSMMRLRTSLNADFSMVSGDTLARDSSGVFLLLITCLRHSEDAIGPARRIMSAFDAPFVVREQDVFLTASIGIAVHPVDAHDAETLIRNAHQALSNTKSAGASSFCFYASSMNENALDRVHLENALRRAVDNKEFELYYQPKVDCKTGRIVGMEALIRWKDSKLGFVSPGKFIPLAEEQGLIVPIGLWVLRTACEQLSAWDKAGLPPLLCSVNVAAQQLEDDSFAEELKKVISDTNIEPYRIELELTERVLMNDLDLATRALCLLSSVGCRISLDDFGTGFSSLSYLNRFPLDIVKLDRSFILDVTHSDDQATLVAALIELLKKLRLEVVAEGIEERAQLEFLRGTGCDLIQGYLFAKPMPPDIFAEWVFENSKEPTLASAG